MRGRARIVVLATRCLVVAVPFFLLAAPAAWASAGSGGVPATAKLPKGAASPGFSVSVLGGAPGATYASLDLLPGESMLSGIVVTNLSSQVEVLKVLAATGRTASDSGDAYRPDAGPCVGAACWLIGLPPVISIPAGKSRSVLFKVSVPPRAPDGDYLAGVVLLPASYGSPHVMTMTKGVRANTTVVHGLAVGEAITVGNAASLVSSLRVEGVSVVHPPLRAGSNDGPVMVEVTEHDDGETWLHPRGVLSIRLSRRVVSRVVVSSTVLPGGTATLEVAVEGVPAGVWPAGVLLCFDSSRSCTEWSGKLAFPAVAASSSHGSRRGFVVDVLGSHLPAWEGSLLTGLAVLVLLAGLVAGLVAWRRARLPTGD